MLSTILPAIYGIPSRHVSPLEPCVVSLGEIRGGAAPNVIPKEVYVQGTIRSYGEETRHRLWEEVEGAFKLSETMGGSYAFKLHRGYPCLFNDEKVNGWIRPVARAYAGTEKTRDIRFGMGAEDFAYMARKAPGAMFMLGAALSDGVVRNHHTPVFDIDESVLPLGAAILAETARRFVTGEVG
jgi:amidohydrolase